MDSNATDSSTSGSRHAPPLVVITDTDQSGILIIAGALGLVFAVISILIRLFIRYEFRTRFSKDDVACFASMVMTPVISPCLGTVRQNIKMVSASLTAIRYLALCKPPSSLLPHPKALEKLWPIFPTQMSRSGKRLVHLRHHRRSGRVLRSRSDMEWLLEPLR